MFLVIEWARIQAMPSSITLGFVNPTGQLAQGVVMHSAYFFVSILPNNLANADIVMSQPAVLAGL